MTQSPFRMALCVGLITLSAGLPAAVAGTEKPTPETKSAPAASGDGDKLARSIEGDPREPVRRTLRGRLDPGDRRMGDGSYFESHYITLSRGDRLTAEMRSDDLDAFLLLFRVAGEQTELVAEDDDSGGGLNARISTTVDRGGEYILVANSAFADEFGSYTVSVTIDPDESPFIGDGNPVGSIELNGSVNGVLDRSTDNLLPDDTPFDMYIFEGRRGQVVEVSMQSRAFDAYLMVADANAEVIAYNDDTGGSLNSRVRLTLPADGRYFVIANCVAPQSAGAYTVALELVEQAQASVDPGNFEALYPMNGSPHDRYALLVGIDDYPGTGNDLSSCVNDVREMRRVLIQQLGFDPENIVVITDAAATRDHIIQAFVRHLGQAGANGCAFFYYSGHGLQLGRDVLNQDEADDGKDEALYVWGQDFRSSVIVDDELGQLLSMLRTDNRMAILDCCHSGTATLGIRTKSVSIDDPAVKEHLALPSDFVAGAKFAADYDAMDHTVLAACRADQLALAGGTGRLSVFTDGLIRELQAAGPDVPMSELIGAVRRTVRFIIEEVMDIEHDQFPQLEGPARGRGFAQALGIRS